jgi:hexosaminidase
MMISRRGIAVTLTGVFFASLACMAEPAAPAADAARMHDLLPVPAELSFGAGRLPLDSGFTLGLTGADDPRVQASARRWIARLEKRTGLHFAARAPLAGKGVVTVVCAKAGLPVQSVREDEAYTLTIDDKGGALAAENALGILRGLETLLQWVRQDGGKYYLPAVAIKDKPRFPWRGLLIDAGRHWQPVEVIKRNLDGMAEAKLNVLHWHLSDDQGFRIESKKFPKLQQMGSDGNYYTQQQVKDVLAHARERGIRVMPEFDVPGHATSWLVGYPELAAGPGPYSIERRMGIFEPALDPSREEVYKFLDAFIGEIAALFPDEYFHIGGDEVTGRQWNASTSIQSFMNKNGLKTNGDLHAYFNGRLSRILAAHGKKMVGWDEIVHPDLPRNIVVHSWRSPEGLAANANNGFDGILSWGYYLDLIKPASRHYAVDPIPAGSAIAPAARAHVLGGEACMWSEFVSPETIDSRIWPRLLAVAERLWSPQETQDVADLYRRMDVESRRLEEQGLLHRSNYLPMLERLVGKENAPSLQTLADVVTPLKEYRRGGAREYTSLMPLTRLVDAARPESETARGFQQSVDAWLQTAPKFGDASALRKQLVAWKQNHARLGPVLEKSEQAREAFSQSQDLSTAAGLGLEAVNSLAAGSQAPAFWAAKADAALKRAAQPRAEVDIAVLPAIAKLTVAAACWDSLKTLTSSDRAAVLKSKLSAYRPPGRYDED